MRKVMVVFIACGVLGVLSAACAGPMGKGEGEGCGSNDDCSSNLICQPVAGRGTNCCPSPLQREDGVFTSKETGCQPVSQ